MTTEFTVNKSVQLVEVGTDAGRGQRALAVQGFADQLLKVLRIVLKIEPATSSAAFPKNHVDQMPSLLVDNQAKVYFFDRGKLVVAIVEDDIMGVWGCCFSVEDLSRSKRAGFEIVADQFCGGAVWRGEENMTRREGGVVPVAIFLVKRICFFVCLG